MAESTSDVSALEEIGIGRAFSQELCTMLEHTVLFHEFSHPEIETLVKYVHAYRAPKGATLFREGERDSYMCIITKGKIDIFKEGQEFKNKKLTTVREGSAIGEMCLIDNFPHSATAIAATETEFVTLTKSSLQTISEEHPRLGNKVLWRLAWQLSARLRQTSGILVDYLN